MRAADVAAELGKPQRVRKGWLACCPAHDDTNPSLWLWDDDAAKVAFQCLAGCDWNAVRDALSVVVPDLKLDEKPKEAENVRPGRPSEVATYDYCDERGDVRYQVVRYEPKNFRQRRPDGKGGWIWNLKGVPLVSYRLPELLASEGTVFLTEGEKDVDALRGLGLAATCNPMGAGKWQDDYSVHLQGRDCVILPDNDMSGKKHAQNVARSIFSVVKSVKIVELPNSPPRGDVSDWLATGGTVEELHRLSQQARNWDFGQDSQGTTRAALDMICLADVAPEPVSWLWPEKIALGKLTMIVGDPDKGKSLFTAFLAAHVTLGKAWPVGGAACPSGSVLMASAEDDPADTIRPRLDAAGANMRRVHIIPITQRGSSGKVTTLSLGSDLDKFDEALSRRLDCRLLILDPISAYLGNTNSHSNTEVRALLAPLSDLAAKHRVAIVCVSHLNKDKEGGNAIYRTNGSLAFVAAARAQYLVTEDKDDPTRRLVLRVKNNLSQDRTGLAFSIRAGTNGAPVVDLEPNPVEMVANDVMGAATKIQSSKLDDAMDWLSETLAEGPVSQKEVRRRGEINGYSYSTLRRAKDELGVITEKQGFGAKSQWRWRLPERADEWPKDAQAPIPPKYEHLWGETSQRIEQEQKVGNPKDAQIFKDAQTLSPRDLSTFGPTSDRQRERPYKVRL